MDLRIAVAACMARLPGKFKSELLARAGNRLLRGLPSDHPGFAELRTNLGVGLGAPFVFPAGHAFPGHWFGPAFGHRGESGAMRVLDALASSYTGLLDIGAHLGVYSLVLAMRNPRLNVHAFEPTPSLARALEKNARAVGPRVQVQNRAVADRCGSTRFHVIPGDGQTSSLVSTRADSVDIDVEVITVDAFMREIGATPAEWLLKVDVENAEAQVLDGARHTLLQTPALVIELLKPAREAMLVERIVKEFGMRAYYIAHDTLFARNSDDGIDVKQEYNWLFTRIPEAELLTKLRGSGLRIDTSR